MSKLIKQEKDYTLNAICPYFTMFPLIFPFSILKRHAKEGQWVLDPFCGRGTTNYASRSLKLSSIGIDSNPTAVAITQAKLANTSPAMIVNSAKRILDEIEKPAEMPDNEFWNLAYHKSVLQVMCRLREGLMKNCASETRRALRAIIMGALHGPVTKSFPNYLSNQCPRTYAPKPAYAIKYWERLDLKPSKVDVMEIIKKRAERYYCDEIDAQGEAILGDSSDPGIYSQIQNKFNWVITSPPYYGMRTYVPDQWLRLWFIGGKAEVDYSPCGQINHSSVDTFCSELKKVWENVGSKCEENARLIVRFGSLNSRKSDPIYILRQSLKNTGWNILTIHEAGTAAKGRRQSLHFLTDNKKAFQEYDLWAIWRK